MKRRTTTRHLTALAGRHRQVDVLVHSRLHDGGVGSDLRTAPPQARRVIPSPRRLPYVPWSPAVRSTVVARQFTVLAGWRWRVDVPAYSGLCDDLCIM